MSFLLVLCTCPDAPSAERIAEALVDERLAACVNVLPGIRSIYRWEGAVERADEVLLLAKTTSERFDALQARILALHPATVPEVIGCDIARGLDRYLAWIGAATAVQDDAA